jgi:hypothetical protein
MAESGEVSINNSRVLTRADVGRSIEDREKYKALQTLTGFGLLIPLRQIELFHGRAEKANEDWHVDPSFGISGRVQGLGNINRRSTLYTSDLKTAQDFALARAKEASQRVELQAKVHEIITAHPEATIIDKSFKPERLSSENQEKFNQALESLAIPITEGSPVSFDNRESVEKFVTAVNKSQKIQDRYIVSSDLDELATISGLGPEVVLHLASAFNVRQIALRNPMYLADRILRYPSEIFTDTLIIDGKEEKIPINMEYAERYMRMCHIVGVKQPVISATLNRDIISYSFFDLEKVGTRSQIESQRVEMLKRMGGLVGKFPSLPSPYTAENGSDLLIALQNAHEKPEYLVEVAKQIGDYGKTYDSDAGVWEKFTLGEHTETVLRNFDENFADIIPVDYLAPLRLAILVHDLGKPEASTGGDKNQQRIFNAIHSRRFLSTIGVDTRLTELITAIITDGSDLAFKIQTQSENYSAQVGMTMYAEDVLNRFLGRNEVTDSEIKAFVEMCKIMQLCDGGAYTSMAITRREGKGRFRNAPSFNRSFSSPIGLGKRDIRYRE